MFNMALFLIDVFYCDVVYMLCIRDNVKAQLDLREAYVSSNISSEKRYDLHILVLI